MPSAYWSEAWQEWPCSCSGAILGGRPDDLLRLGAPYTLREHGNPEVGQQHLAIPAEQDVLGFDIAMNEVLVVSILQGRSHVADVLDDADKRQLLPFRMTMAQ